MKKSILLVLLLVIALGAVEGKNQKAAVQTGSISVQAGLVYQSGDVKPVARIELTLLDVSLVEILKTMKDSGVTPEENTSKEKYEKSLLLVFILWSVANKFKGDPLVTQGQLDLFNEAMSAIKPHIVQSTITDFEGKAIFNSVKPGTYYIFGFGTPGTVVWDVKFEFKGGAASIILDNNNASLVSGS